MPFPEELKTKSKAKTSWVKYVAIGVACLFMGCSVYLATSLQKFTDVSDCTPEATYWLVMLQHESGNVTASPETIAKVKKIKFPAKENRTVIDTIKFGMTINQEVTEVLPNFVKVCDEFQARYTKECPVKMGGLSIPNGKGASSQFRKLFSKHTTAAEEPVNIEAFTLQDLLQNLESEDASICNIDG